MNLMNSKRYLFHLNDAIFGYVCCQTNAGNTTLSSVLETAISAEQ